jgi:hypothetical protein
MEEENVLLELMIQRGKDPACRLDDAKELFPSMASKGHEPDVVSCNVLINELF